jgi:hypothetical protein
VCHVVPWSGVNFDDSIPNQTTIEPVESDLINLYTSSSNHHSCIPYEQDREAYDKQAESIEKLKMRTISGSSWGHDYYESKLIDQKDCFRLVLSIDHVFEFVSHFCIQHFNSVPQSSMHSDKIMIPNQNTDQTVEFHPNRLDTSSHNSDNSIYYDPEKEVHIKNNDQIEKLKIKNISESFLGHFTSRFGETIRMEMKKSSGGSKNLYP